MGRSEHFADGAAEHFRGGTPVPVEHYGMVRPANEDVPPTYIAHHAYLGPENDKHGTQWQGAKVEHIPAGTPVKTTQDFVGKEHVERYMKGKKPGAARPVDFGKSDDEGRGQGSGTPRLLRIGGDLWGVDGHHRVAAANELHRGYHARVMDVDEAQRNLSSHGPAPRERGHLVDHLTEGHLDDNTMVGEDHWHPDHANYGPGENYSWSDKDIRDYHDSLHADGVADHHHH